MGLVVAACVLASGGPALASDAEVLARADSFLHSQRLDRARQGLAPDEKLALGRALGVPGRQLTEDAVAGLLRNPTAWSRSRSEGRGLLRTIVKSLPEVAGLPGINHTLKLASNVEPSNYRGYGVEVIAAAALARYRTETGDRARVTRMSADIRGIDGQLHESDGAVLIGADGIERLVTVKSVLSPRSITRRLNKATEQLALRNLERGGRRRPGVMIIGYDNAAVFDKLQRQDWQASADRTGAKLLVLAVEQSTGRTTKLAAFEPRPHATITPKTAGAHRHDARWSGQHQQQVGQKVGTRNSWLGRSGRAIDRSQPLARWRPALRWLPGARRAGSWPRSLQRR